MKPTNGSLNAPQRRCRSTEKSFEEHTMTSVKAVNHMIRGLGLAIVLACSLATYAQDSVRASGKITMKVDFESGAAGFNQIKVNLYRAADECCKDCLPNTCTRKCCPIGSYLVRTINLLRGQKIEFTDLPPGNYFVENEAEGKSAGFEQLVPVKENQKVDLGRLSVDRGTPLLKNRIYHRPTPP